MLIRLKTEIFPTKKLRLQKLKEKAALTNFQIHGI